MPPERDGGPVSPVVVPGFLYADGSYETPEVLEHGMSLRDYFAGQALAGMLADPQVTGKPDTTAGAAYRYADAMLKARALP